MRFLTLVLVALGACGRAPEPPAPQPPKAKVDDFAPINEDAAKIYEAQSWKDVEIPDSVISYRTPNIATREEVDQVLERSKDRLLAFERAARATKCEWKVARIDLFAEHPHSAGIVKAWRLLRVSFFRRMEAGEKKAAAKVLATGLKTAVDYTTHPVLICKLLGCVGIALMTDALHSTLSVYPFDRGELDFLEQQLAKQPGRVPAPSKFFADELACVRAAVDPMLEMGFAKAVSILSMTKQESVHMSLVDEILSRDKAASRAAIVKRIDGMGAVVAPDVEQPLHSTQSHFDSKAYQDEAVRDLAVESVRPSKDPVHQLEVAAKVVTAVIAPPHLSLRKAPLLARLKLDFILLWIRLQRTALEQGSYPKDLDGRGASVRDPYDGGSIKYLRHEFETTSIFILTAAGPDNDWKKRFQRFESNKFIVWNLIPSDSDEAEYTWIGHLAARPK